MKIIQINAVNVIGSTGRTCYEESKYLCEHGHQAFTIYSQGSSEYGICVSIKWEEKLHALLSRITGLQAYFSFFETKKIINILKHESPDIVHLRNLHANYVCLPMLIRYLRRNDIATVLTLHDCWFFTGKCTHYTSINCRKWENGCSNCPQLKQDNKSWVFDRTRKIWKDKRKMFRSIPRLAVTGVSDWITGEGRKSVFFENAGIIERVYNWIDLTKFHPNFSINQKERLGIVGCNMILGVASGWSNKKGLDRFIEISKDLAEEDRIVLVGQMPSIDLPRNIIHIPATNNVEELVGLYSAADVFVQFSDEETFGKVVAEALACGTPVVTTGKTANPELISDECGIVIDQYQSAKAVKAIQTVIFRGKDTYTNACIEHAEKLFKMENCVEHYLEIYREVINRTR